MKLKQLKRIINQLDDELDFETGDFEIKLIDSHRIHLGAIESAVIDEDAKTISLMSNFAIRHGE